MISQLFPIFIVANATPLAQETPVEETTEESATTKDEFAQFSALIGAGFSGLSAGFGYNVNEKLNVALIGTYMPPGVIVVDDVGEKAFGGVDFPGTEGSGGHYGVIASYRFIGDLQIAGGVGVTTMAFTFQSDDETLAGTTTYSPLGFYGGLRYGVKTQKGFIWGIDAGAVYTGPPIVTFTTGNDIVTDETRQDAEDHFFTVWPALQVSIGYGL